MRVFDPTIIILTFNGKARDRSLCLWCLQKKSLWGGMDILPVQTMARINFATKMPAWLILWKNNFNVSTFFASFFIPLSLSLSYYYSYSSSTVPPVA